MHVRQCLYGIMWSWILFLPLYTLVIILQAFLIRVHQQGSQTGILQDPLSCCADLHQFWSTTGRTGSKGKLFSWLSPTPILFSSSPLYPPSQADGPIAVIVDALLHMLEKDVIDNSKTCAEYFEFFKNYSSHVRWQTHYH